MPGLRSKAKSEPTSEKTGSSAYASSCSRARSRNTKDWTTPAIISIRRGRVLPSNGNQNNTPTRKTTIYKTPLGLHPGFWGHSYLGSIYTLSLRSNLNNNSELPQNTPKRAVGCRIYSPQKYNTENCPKILFCLLNFISICSSIPLAFIISPRRPRRRRCARRSWPGRGCTTAKPT